MPIAFKTKGALRADEVETVNIADDAVTNPKVADDAIDTDQIADGAIINALVDAAAAIDQSKLVVNQVGSYTGDSSSNRAIPHGMGTKPKLVFILSSTNILFFIHTGTAAISFNGTTIGSHSVTSMDTDDFFVGAMASFPNSANSAATTYRWVAFP